MKGGKRHGIRFLSYSQTAKKARSQFTQASKTQQKTKTVVFKSPFGRLILGKCGGC